LKAKSKDTLMSGFLSNAIKLTLFIFIFLLTLNIAGLSSIAGAILATAGASAVVIGFAFKDIAENFLAGIILAFNRPFHVDDTVRIEDVFGKIKSMEFRYTKIATFDGRNVYIPNSDVLTKPVYNYTEDGFFRADCIVGIAYENDIEKGKEIIKQCFADDRSIIDDEHHVCFVVEDELAASTVNLKVFFWVKTDDFRRGMLEIRGNLLRRIKTSLESNGFNLPAEIRELKFYDASKPFQLKSEHEGRVDKTTT
jgi:small conductance mechanosensitive channel